MLLIYTFLLHLTRSQDTSNIVPTREDCEIYQCAQPDGYAYAFGMADGKNCFFGAYTCESCCNTDKDLRGRTCWTEDWLKVNCCAAPFAHDRTCDPDASCVLGDAVDPSTCTSCGQVLTQEIVEPAIGGGACDPETYTCQPGDGACEEDIDCVLGALPNPDDCTSCGQVLTQSITTPASGNGACSPATYTCQHEDGACIEDRDCVLGAAVNPDDCTSCGQVLTQSVTTPATGNGACSPASYTCQHEDGACIEDRNCVLGGAIDVSACTTCGQVLTQEVVTAATGAGTCNPDTYTCAHGDGSCIVDVDCELSTIDPSTCTSCGQVLTQAITVPPQGIGECNPQSYTCADGDGSCVEDADCVLGGAIDTSLCGSCDEVLTQEILTPAIGSGTCAPATHTCGYGDGQCQEPCDYIQVGNPCPNPELPGPVDYVFVFDTTSFITDEQYNQYINEMALAVELNLREEDNFALVMFSDNPVLIVDWTNDASAAAETIRLAPRPHNEPVPYPDYALAFVLSDVWAGNVDASRDQRTYLITYENPPVHENPCGKVADYHAQDIDLYAVLPGPATYDCFEENDVFMSKYLNFGTMLSQHAFVDPACGSFTAFDGFYTKTGDNDFGPVYANNAEQTLGMTYGDPTVQVWQFTHPDTSVMISVYMTPGASLRPPDQQRWEYEGPDVLTVAFSALDVECRSGPKPSSSPVTSRPSDNPSRSPTTSRPTDMPTKQPTTSDPSNMPSASPSNVPSHTPTDSPTTSPSNSPTPSPTDNPVTSDPTEIPSDAPSYTPSKHPSSSCKPFILGSEYSIPDDILNAQTDFGLILDSSSSVSDDEFDQIMESFAQLVLDYFTEEKERAGLMIFSSFYRHEFGIEHRPPSETAELFRNTTRIYGATLTSTALYFAYQEMWLTAGVIDPSIRQRAVMITDGKPSAGQDACSQVHLYQNSGLELYVVAIGDDAFWNLQCFLNYGVTVVHVDNIERLVEDLPKYLEIELIDRIHFDAYYDCTEEERNGAPVYVSDQGWEAFLDIDGHWTITDPSGSINCDLIDSETSTVPHPEDGRTWTCFNGVFENVSVEFWSRSPTKSPTDQPTTLLPSKHPIEAPPCDTYCMQEVRNLQSRVDSLQQRVDELESEVASQSDDLATCEGKFDEIYSAIETILSDASTS